MALDKVTYTDLVTHIPAANMNAIQDEIIAHGTRLTSLENGCETYYGTCSTTTNATKDVNLQAGSSFLLRTGTLLTVKFSYSAYAGSSTLYLRVNSGTAKAIYRNATTTEVAWAAGQTVDFVYDGTYWQQITPPPLANYVTSVNGKQGVVVLTEEDLGITTITDAEIEALF